MFRDLVERTLSTLLRLLLQTQTASLEILSCLGRVLSAIITTVGPELQVADGGAIEASKFILQVRPYSLQNLIAAFSSFLSVRSSFLCACAILQSHPHPVIQAEAITCLQQLHMFAGNVVNPRR